MSEILERKMYKKIAEITHEFPNFDVCEDPIQEHIMMFDNATKNAKEDDEFIKKYLGEKYVTGPSNAKINCKCTCKGNHATMDFVYAGNDSDKIVLQYTCNKCKKTTLVCLEKE